MLLTQVTRLTRYNTARIRCYTSATYNKYIKYNTISRRGDVYNVYEFVCMYLYVFIWVYTIFYILT